MGVRFFSTPSATGPEPARANAMIMRKLHLYAALVFGLLFSLLGLAGSWLVFYPEIDSALLGFSHQSSGAPHWEQVLRAGDASTHAPGQMSMLLLPWGEAGTAYVMTQKGAEMTSIDYGRAYIDAGTGRVLAAGDVVSRSQGWRKNISGIAFVIHSGLIFGPLGAATVGVLGLFLFFSLLTGVYLWWPRGRWRSAFFLILSKAGSRAFLGELHSICGLYASLLLGLAALTGFYYAFQPLVRSAVAAVLPVAPSGGGGMASMAEHVGMSMGGPGGAMDADAAVTRAKSLFPDRPLKMLMRMGAEHPIYQISLAATDRSPSAVGETQLTLDGSGAILGIRDPAHERAGDTLVRWLIPLHTGVAFGIAGRVVMSIVGLTPTFFFVTGVWVWLRRRSATRRARSNRSNSVSNRAALP